MPKIAKELSARAVRKIKSDQIPGMYAVGGVHGLHLKVKSTGACSWILRTKVGDRRPDIGLGGFTDVTLEQARQRAREIKDQIAQGIDPLIARREAKARLKSEQAKQLTFDQAARACHESRSVGFKNRKHAQQWINTLTTYASPVIGSLPVKDVETAHIQAILEPIWTSKTETATRVRGRLETVLSWATVSGFRSGENPARWRGHLDQVLPQPSKVRKVKHHKALDWREMGGFMAKLREREDLSASALEFAILTAARSEEVREAVWEEIDLEAKLWTVPAERMKGGKTHRVPLSDQAVKLIKTIPRHDASPYVFWAPRGGRYTDMALLQVLRRMDLDVTVHGFRSSFKDWCRNSTAYADEVSELALAHVNNDATRSAYARDELLPMRARLMNEWARYCNQTNSKTATIANIQSKSENS